MNLHIRLTCRIAAHPGEHRATARIRTAETGFSIASFRGILLNRAIHVVIPAMMRVEHIRANVEAVANSRFDDREIAQIRRALADAA
jgi:hypothetical protein